MTSSSFDKMLSQYQGNLPNISDTNYTSELDYTLTEEVNKEIDNLKTDFSARTAEAVTMAENAAKSRDAQLKSLVGLVGSGKKLYDYWEAKDQASALYDSIHKSELELGEIKSKKEIQADTIAYSQELYEKHSDSIFSPQAFIGSLGPEKTLSMYKELDKLGYLVKREDGVTITEDGRKYINEKYIKEEDKKIALENQKLINQYHKEQLEERDNQLDIQERLNLIKANQATIDELTAKELMWRSIEEFDAIFPSLLAVKKQIPGMDKPLSYMDATSKDASAEDASWAAVLLRDAMADYTAFNSDYIEKIGEKRWREKVFPDLYERAQVTHKKFMNAALENARDTNDKNNAKAFAATFRREGLSAIIGSSGSVSTYEQMVDGTKNNGIGFDKSLKLITRAVDEGYLSGRELRDAIDDPFPARGSNQMTTLEELKPVFYNQLSTIANNDIKDELLRDKAEMANDILQQTDNIRTQAKEQKWSTDQTKAEATKVWTELAKKHNISPANPAFADLISLANYGQTMAERSGNALLILQGQEARGELLSSDLIAKLPQELQKIWTEKAKVLGTEGLTKEELEDADTEFVALIKDYKKDWSTDKILGPKMRLARTRMNSLFNATYQQLMRSDNREDTLAAKKDNIDKAMDIVRTEFKTVYTKDPEKHSPKIFGPRVVPDYRLEVAEEAQLVQYLNSEDKPTDDPLYWNADEEQAVINSLAAEEKGEPISAFWTDKAKYFPNMTGRELFKKRAEATADLREGEIGDIKIEDKFRLKPLAIKQNSAKTGQYSIVPDNTENMLTELKVKDADYNSTFRVPVRVPEFDPSQMTIRELLQFRTDNYETWNDDIGLGIYDMQTKEFIEMLKIPGVVEELGGVDAVFDEKMQKKLMKIKLLLKANQAGGMKSFNNSYRKINHITDDEQVAYNGIVSEVYGEELANDPFRGLNTLTSEVAKVALEDVMAYA